MTVKELKASLRGIPDNTPVIGLHDGNGYVDISSVRLNEEENEDGKYSEVIINVMNQLDW
jgi:hypothetical protein